MGQEFMTNSFTLSEWQVKYNTQLSILEEIKGNKDLLRFKSNK
ncbi:MAG: hypothetical protein ACFFAK_01605 [Promethearchaeota archaeon]